MKPMKEVTSMITLMQILPMMVSLSTENIQQLDSLLRRPWYSLLSSFLMILHHQVLLLSVLLHSSGISNPSLIWPYDPMSILRELNTISASARSWKRNAGERCGEMLRFTDQVQSQYCEWSCLGGDTPTECFHHRHLDFSPPSSLGYHRFYNGNIFLIHTFSNNS